MARVINDECVKCGTCEAECPVSAISEGEDTYVVDADSCIDCGACEAACPVGAISEAFDYRRNVITEQKKSCPADEVQPLQDFFFSETNGHSLHKI